MCLAYMAYLLTSSLIGGSGLSSRSIRSSVKPGGNQWVCQQVSKGSPTRIKTRMSVVLILVTQHFGLITCNWWTMPPIPSPVLAQISPPSASQKYLPLPSWPKRERLLFCNSSFIYSFPWVSFLQDRAEGLYTAFSSCLSAQLTLLSQSLPHHSDFICL